MSKFKKKFVADAFVSREYKSAITLEEYLKEIDSVEATRYANNVLRRFNNLFKPLYDLKSHQEYYAKILVDQFEEQIMKPVLETDGVALIVDGVPLFVRTLLVNVIKTKYKVEILEYGKGKNLPRKD